MSNQSTINNTLTIPEILKKEVQRQNLKNSIMTMFANREFEGELKKAGDTVDIQEFPNLIGNRSTSASAGQDITARTYATQKHSLQVNELVNDRVKVPDLEEIRASFNTQQEISKAFAYWISQSHERHIGLTAAGAAGTVINSGSPAAISESTVIEQVRKFGTALHVLNVEKDQAGVFLDPLVIDLIATSDKFEQCDKGVELLMGSQILTINKGFTNMKINGVRVYASNNLPHKQKLTLDTNPTADDTITITITNDEAKSTDSKTTTITWTWKASASGAGEITIGANAAASQTNLIAALLGPNRSGTAASGYVDVSAANRKLMDNAEITCSTFSSNIATIRANNKIVLGETFTAASNVFGTAAQSAICFDTRAVNFVDQLTKMKVTDAEAGFYANILYESAFQAKVLGRNVDRVVESEFQYLSL